MVLLPKQVHLQYDVGAGGVSNGERLLPRSYLHAARDSDRNAKKARTARKYFLMVAVVDCGTVAQHAGRAVAVGAAVQGPLGLRWQALRGLQEDASTRSQQDAGVSTDLTQSRGLTSCGLHSSQSPASQVRTLKAL